MTKDEIMEMARQAGWSKDYLEIGDERLERFANLVAQHEREACAKVCENSVEYAGDTLAQAIRARNK